MNRFAISAAGLCIGLSLLFGVAGPSSAATGRERLRAFTSDLVSLKARFRQTVFDEQHQPTEDSRGIVYLQRPGRFRWSYTEPYPQEIVADGKRVWIYDSELAQVTVKRLNLALGQTPALLLTTRQPLEKSFFIKELGSKDGLAWLELKPRRADATFTSMRLALDSQALRIMELTDSFGQRTEIRFSAIEKNPRIAPSRFVFSPPAGTDVIKDDEAR